MAANNKNLHEANRAKKDEFYTQKKIIEDELKHYKDHFRGKVIYCNCDDPKVSEFSKFFRRKFEHWGLKKLIATCYKNQDLNSFSRNASKRAAYLEYFGKNNEKRGKLNKDGDFRSKECIELLEQADIVVTNPPFSQFREYMAQLIEYDKMFLIIGNVNAITYKEIFPLIKDGKLWLGASIHSGDREFGIPDGYPLNAVGCRVDENGKKYIRVKGVRWFTNLDYKERHEDLILYKKYNPDEYPKYDNYDAINVNKTAEIPMDYFGAMGVPITFLDKYNPEQFEVIGIDRALVEETTGKISRFRIKGNELYARIIIKNKRLKL